MDYCTIRGDVYDIVETKEKNEYEIMFREYREGALLLVEGHPGSGKNTLVHKVTRLGQREKCCKRQGWCF